MKNSFWINGANEYTKELTSSFNDRMAGLQSLLQASVSDEQRASVQAEIEKLQNDHKARLNGIVNLLF